MASPKKSNANNTIAKSGKNNFYNFLEGYRVKSEKDKITHTSWGKIMGKYSIPDDVMETFYKLYEKEVIGNKKFGFLNIIEQHRDVAPIIIDIDFKFDDSIAERKYTTEHIEKIVSLYMKEIEETFSIYSKTYELIAFVFQREEPYKFKGDTRDGIHIMFPFIVSEPNVQYVIRENIIKKVQNDKILDDIPFKNQLTDVFDRSIISKNGWFMYGSSKPYCKPYILTHVYDYHMELIDPIDVEYRDAQGNKINNLPKFLSIRRHKKEDCQEIRDSKFDDLERLSKRQTAFQLNKMKRIHSNTYDIKQISQLVNILSPKRWENYKQWIKVGWCLHNIGSEDIELLNLWIEFSKNWPRFKEGECEKEWAGFRKHGKLLGIGSLHHWAKKDNYEKYLDIRRQDIRYYIDKSINCTNYDVAKVLNEMFKYQFVYDKNKIWYEFKNHRWQEDDDGISLRQKISTDLVNEYIKIISDYNQMIVKLDDDPELTEEEKDKEKTKYEERAKSLTTIVLKLKTTSFKDNIMKECKELFYEKDFSKKLDEHNYLIGFEDGVYDLEAGEFREGIPEDYISRTTGNYYLEYDENNPQIEDIMEFIRQIFPVYSVRHYILKMLASMLQGYNAEEKFRILTGCGSNGKGKLLELFTMATGEYTKKMDISLLVGKRASSNAATPEIAETKGTRCLIFDEPEEGANINVGLMKEYSGGDKVKGRALFRAPIEFKPQFKMILLCNDLPKVPPHDGGVWRRLEVTECTSKFVDNPKEEGEFLRDYNLSEKLKDWKESFMSILLHYHKIYKIEGLKGNQVPLEVTKFTREYELNSDIYTEFIEAILEKVEDKNKKALVPISEIYKEFKLWYQEDNHGIKAPSRREFKSYLIKKFAKKNIQSDYLKGYILHHFERKSSEEEARDEDSPHVPDLVNDNDPVGGNGDDENGENDVIVVE